MSTILDRIKAYKLDEIASNKAARPIARVEEAARNAAEPRGFARALQHASGTGYGLIAELKKASPSKGLIRADFDPPALARAYQDGGAACLSVLTDGPSFQGDDAYLVSARAAVTLPCIRKDFLVDPWQVAESRSLGADAILVILAMIEDSVARQLMDEAERLGMDALVEVHDADEMHRALALGANLIGINNRDLKTFIVDLAVTESLASLCPQDIVLVTESGIFTAQDAQRMAKSGARAMLVGESLMRQDDVTAATRALLA